MFITITEGDSIFSRHYHFPYRLVRPNVLSAVWKSAEPWQSAPPKLFLENDIFGAHEKLERFFEKILRHRLAIEEVKLGWEHYDTIEVILDRRPQMVSSSHWSKTEHSLRHAFGLEFYKSTLY